MTREKKIYPYTNQPIRKCRSCGKEIWFHCEIGKRPIPINKETGEPHFADCPDADKFRKRGKDGDSSEVR